MREYVIKRYAGSSEREPDAENYLARTVFEADELIDIGILDHAGNKVMARRKMDQIGFIRRRET